MKLLKFSIAIFCCISIYYNCNAQNQNHVIEDGFSFAFFTDIHLNKAENDCFKGFEKAIINAEAQGINFILTGGDNCEIDKLKNDTQTAHELYKGFAELATNSSVPFYPALGNHDRYWGVDKEDPLFNEGLFENYIGRKSYYSFDHKGWHFIVLNTANSVVDDVQKKWLQDDLANTSEETPTVVVVHVPFLTVYYPALQGRYTSADTFSNFKEIWDMFNGRNLKLVLQGHQHLYEEIKVLDTQFITAGAVCAYWWAGPYHGTEEGYLKVDVGASDNISWKYVNYGWETNYKHAK